MTATYMHTYLLPLLERNPGAWCRRKIARYNDYMVSGGGVACVGGC